MTPEILVVDDDASHLQMIETVLTAEGYRTTLCTDGREAVAAVSRRLFDLILMDIRMRHTDGIAALKQIREASPSIPVIMMTAYASVGTAVDALKSGAFDYLTKPLDIDELKILVDKALRHQKITRENSLLRERLRERFDFSRIVAVSPPMQQLFETLSLVAPTDATVLILGESGTGKELIANAIHENSRRADKPFVAVNCAALPEPLLESELFGHEKGAFTGAVKQNPGRLRMAHTGTLFLDEIGEMGAAVQAKLLRVLQEQTFEPLGATRTVHTDIRFIAATNRELQQEIGAGRFREDLYYRLNVFTVTMPPLRERPDDLLPLAETFIQRHAARHGRSVTGLSPRCADLLRRYDWPGNVRELENAMERAVILARGSSITPAELPDPVRESGGAGEDPTPAIAPGTSLREMEKRMILRTLADTGGNRTQTAEILGISRRTLQLKLKQYGINP